MTITQIGTFHAGTYGFPVYIQLPDDLSDPTFLTGTVGISYTVTRPDGTIFGPRNLTLPGDITNNAGVIRYMVQNGDLTINGVYEILISVNYGSPPVLMVEGDFTVSE